MTRQELDSRSRGHEREGRVKLATFSTGGRTSYGAVVGDGIVDLALRLSHKTLLDLLRAGALGEAKVAAGQKPDVALADVTLLPPEGVATRPPPPVPTLEPLDGPVPVPPLPVVV